MIQSLNGPWHLSYWDGERGQRPAHLHDPKLSPPGLPATVPGDVHLDLIQAGLLDEPALGLNSLHARWVEHCLWSWRHVFQPDPALQSAHSSPIWLVFEQIAGRAEIWLNGHLLGTHHNDFRPARFEISRLLVPGQNTLVVQIEAGTLHLADKPGTPYHNNVAACAPKRMWARKPQSQFSWDWAPRLLNIGLAGDVRLESTGTPLRLDQVVPLITVQEDLLHATVRVRAWVENTADIPHPIVLDTSLPGLQLAASQSAEIPPGLHPIETEIHAQHPPLWWPRGHGQPHLEPLHITLKTCGREIGHHEAPIGFRRITLDESPHPTGGHFFTLRVNNRPIFCKGANLVPPDLIYCRADASRYDTLLDRAEELNFNFLRVWGGGVYECEHFYREADRRGFMVWQDFIYACSKFPLDDHAFCQEAIREATWQVRRLASHPSLVLWCGNNELETADWHWSWDKWGAQSPHHGFFHITLPQLMQREDPTRIYWPSSPYSRNHQDPNSDSTGDQHPWSLGFFDTDYRGYRKMTCRFPNEGGVLGPPSLPTLLACLPKNQQKIGSPAWNHHDNSVAFWAWPAPVNQQIKQWTGRTMENLSLTEYVYYGGLTQGEGLREYIENFRRRMFDSSAAVFWMFNDTWPTVRSWTPVDYYLRRTPSFYFVRRAMQPITVAIVQESDHVRIMGINDTPQAFSGQLRYGLFSTLGDYALDLTIPAHLPPNASTEIARFPATHWNEPLRQLAFAVLTTNDKKTIARARLIRPFPADLTWAKPEISLSVTDGGATFTSPVFVWAVCLDLNGDQTLSDNFFDLYPGQPYRIPWPSPQPPRVLHCGNVS